MAFLGVFVVLSLCWLGIVAFGSVLYALTDIDRGRLPLWSIWWDYFSHAAFFRR